MTYIKCRISTPQFMIVRGVSIVRKYHKQRGTFCVETMLFTPKYRLFGNHSVQFHKVGDFVKAWI